LQPGKHYVLWSQRSYALYVEPELLGPTKHLKRSLCLVLLQLGVVTLWPVGGYWVGRVSGKDGLQYINTTPDIEERAWVSYVRLAYD
jgi:hypothetical protein